MKKIIKVAKSFAAFMYFCFWSLMLFSINAQAYIDPSAITYLIQIVSGIAIVLGAGVGVFIKKTKNKIIKKNQDNIKGKEIESDEI